ncbi:putative signal transducing protein [Promineifilum sp.]|uniref:putative signal transducing protein n=1 Tax=Promineifilum sp. TaxID=2664178 RepID=UPI0035AF639E
MDNNNTFPLSEPNDADSAPSGDAQQVQWVVVEQTSGVMAAEIIAGRLQAEGIPARAYQEGAGEAIGLIVGLLGTGHVAVPEEFAEQARAILEAIEAEAEAAEEEE